ncbi:MAG: hypothetical protein ACRCYU_19050 [Nocardioides sp.]
MRLRTSRLALAALIVVPTGVIIAGVPAEAAGCPGATGVTVVVDYHQLGGGAVTGCASAGGGKTASSVFPAAGFPLTYVARSPGFVCRVSGKPAADPCVNTPPATAYWSLWWSDGKSGSWTYSTLGVGSLRVPTGGYVAFSWQGQAGKAAPGIAPTKRAGVVANPNPAKPPPVKPPSTDDPAPNKPAPNKPAPPGSGPLGSGPSGSGPPESGSPGSGPSGAGDGSGSPSSSDQPGASAAGESENATPGNTESADPGEPTGPGNLAPTTAAPSGIDASAASDPPSLDDGASRVPWWLTLVGLVFLASGIGGVTVWRARRTHNIPAP